MVALTWGCAAADAVRGSTSPPDELAYILRHSGAVAVICQDSQALEKLLPALAQYDAQHAAGSSGAGTKRASANGASANVATANGASANGSGGESAAPGVRPPCRLFRGGLFADALGQHKLHKNIAILHMAEGVGS